MSDDDFTKLLSILDTVDGGCSVCVRSAYTRAGQLWPERQSDLERIYAAGKDYGFVRSTARDYEPLDFEDC